MKNIVTTLLLLLLAGPAFAKLNKDVYSVPCSTVWPAVKDVMKNSGKYVIVGIDNGEMAASYIIDTAWGHKRNNSVVLNAKGDSCEMQIQSVVTGNLSNDAGDFKKRVDKSLAKLKASERLL